MSRKSPTYFCESCGVAHATRRGSKRTGWRSFTSTILIFLLGANAALLARQDFEEIKTLVSSIPSLIRSIEFYKQKESIEIVEAPATPDIVPPLMLPDSVLDSPTDEEIAARPKAKKSEKKEIVTGSESTPDIVVPIAKRTRVEWVPTLSFDREAVLSDHLNRIDDAFAISPGLRDRVAFWFDVYSKYDENSRIIHHSRYPWIVYRVVDVTSIINSDTPKHRWLRNVKADKLVDAEIAKVRLAIGSIAKRGYARESNPYEIDVANALKTLGGDLKKQARHAQGSTRIQIGQKNFFEEGLRISHRYLHVMEQEFADRNLPIELSRLPLVESSFNKMATSKVGAAGIWQFMGNTGRKFMIVNDIIDERRSPFKATDAAARLLKENHLILHRSWPLALTAWNHGPGGVRRAIKATGSKDLAKIVGNYQTRSFNFASSNFYAEYLAALHASMYNDQIWGTALNMDEALETHVVKLPRSYRPSHLMKVLGLNKEDVLLLNPDITVAVKRDRALPRGFHFHVPQTIRAKVEQVFAQNDVPATRTKKPSRG